MTVFDSPIVIGLLLGAPASFIAWKGYRRSQKADDRLSDVGSAAQQFQNLNLMIESYQSDIKDWRSRFDALEVRLAECTKDREHLVRKINLLERKYGVNGVNGAAP